MRTIRGLQRRVSVKDNKGKSRLRYYSNYQPDYLYVTLNEEWIKETVDLPFEDTVLMAPRGWHQVLTEVYGDYMQLPPEDKRHSPHTIEEIYWKE